MAERIAVLVHSDVPGDPRVRRQIDALVGVGYEVDCFALREPGQPEEESSGSLRIVRLPVRRTSTGFIAHLAEYVAFTTLAGWRLAREHRRRRYGLVQVHTLPDFLVAAALPLKLRGVPVLLDLHEDLPAFFNDRFSSPLLRPLRHVLPMVANIAARAANHVLTVHEPLRLRAIDRGIAPDRVSVVMNSADEALFHPSRGVNRRFMEDGVLRLVHHSSLQRIYGLEVAVAAVAEAAALPGAPPMRLDVYGDGPHRGQIEAAIVRHDAQDLVHLHGRVAMDDLPRLITAADIGLVPSLPEAYMQLSLSTKLLEYVEMRIPVIASDLATFRSHFDSDAIWYVPGGDAGALARAILALARDPERAAHMTRAAVAQSREYAWARQRAAYLAIVGELAQRRGRAPGHRPPTGSLG